MPSSAAASAGIVPGIDYFLKIRQDVAFVLSADSTGTVVLTDSQSSDAHWTFEEAMPGTLSYWEINLGTDQQPFWRPFGHVQSMIADAEAKGEQHVRYNFEDEPYVIDLAGKVRLNTKTGTKRLIRKIEGFGASFFRIRNASGQYLCLRPGSDFVVCAAAEPALWRVELRGRWQFLSLIEGQTGKHISAETTAEAGAGLESARIAVRTESSQDWATRHWRLVPVGGLGTESGTVICIGDLHGHIDRCRHLWQKLESRLGRARLDSALVLFLGDYCDRGPRTSDVYDWLIQLRDSRPQGKTAFITGNHDFAFASFIGCEPAEYAIGFDLDSTNSQGYTTGIFNHPVTGGMHYQGRRWGGSNTYNANETFQSYGVVMDYTPSSREHLIAAVPEAHKLFLRSLAWVYECDLPYPPGKLIAVHAGVQADRPLQPQLDALRGRQASAPVLQENEFGRFDALSGRGGVSPMHPELEGKALFVSGHHGRRDIEGDRFIIDLSGGKDGRPLEAVIFPERQVISTDDFVGPSGGLERVVVAARIQAAMEAGIIPGVEYYLKLRKNMDFRLNARSCGDVQVWNSIGEHQQWTFEPAGEGYYRLRSVFHVKRSNALSYLSFDAGSGRACIVDVGAQFSLELHGSLHFVALVEKSTGKHLSLDVGCKELQNGATVKLETYEHGLHFARRQWHLSLVPVDPVG